MRDFAAKIELHTRTLEFVSAIQGPEHHCIPNPVDAHHMQAAQTSLVRRQPVAAGPALPLQRSMPCLPCHGPARGRCNTVVSF